MTVLCPVCQTPVTMTEDGCVCRKGHRFDRARSGYMHLLPANRKHAKNPGDDKLMVDARRKFLDKGYYRPLADTVSRLAGEWLANLPHQTPCVLDAGCGEGYYTTLLYDALCQRGLEPDILGVDISKLALDKAAKRQKAIFYVVASVFHLPVPDACCDLLCSLVFALLIRRNTSGSSVRAAPCCWLSRGKIIYGTQTGNLRAPI